jgi:ribosomal protein L40E
MKTSFHQQHDQRGKTRQIRCQKICPQCQAQKQIKYETCTKCWYFNDIKLLSEEWDYDIKLQRQIDCYLSFAFL